MALFYVQGDSAVSKSIWHLMILVFVFVAPTGCANASRRVNPPIVTPRVVSDSPADDALKALAQKKTIGTDNIIFALSYVEAGPAELPSLPTMLESLLSNLVSSGIRYLPWDYFNTNKAPMFFPKNVGIANPAKPQIVVPEGVSPEVAIAKSDFAQLLTKHRNADGTLPKYLRLRIDVTVDKDVRTVSRGVIVRALAKFGSEYAEGNLDVDSQESATRVTCTLTLLTENGDLHESSVVVTADVVRIGAGDKLGVIVAGNGLNVFEKATAAQGMAAAMRETVGHALFVLVCKLLRVEHEAVLAQCRKSGSQSTSDVPQVVSSLLESSAKGNKMAPASHSQSCNSSAVPNRATLVSVRESSPYNAPRVSQPREARSSTGSTANEIVHLRQFERLRLSNGAWLMLRSNSSTMAEVSVFDFNGWRDFDVSISQASIINDPAKGTSSRFSLVDTNPNGRTATLRVDSL